MRLVEGWLKETERESVYVRERKRVREREREREGGERGVSE